jgi:hypothetical protein
MNYFTDEGLKHREVIKSAHDHRRSNGRATIKAQTYWIPWLMSLTTSYGGVPDPVTIPLVYLIYAGPCVHLI